MLRRTPYLIYLLVVTALATEIGSRLIFPEHADTLAYLDRAYRRLLNSHVIPQRGRTKLGDRIGHALSPDLQYTIRRPEYTYTVRTNSLGFRSREIESREPGEIRALLLGDSMLYGVGLEEHETLAAQLESLAAESGAQMRVYNYALPALNTVQVQLVGQLFAEAVAPDHIVVGVFVGNDVLASAASYIDSVGRLGDRPGVHQAYRGKLRRAHGPLIHSIAFRALALPVFVPRWRYNFSVEPETLTPTVLALRGIQAQASRVGARLTVLLLYPRDGTGGGLLGWWSGSLRLGLALSEACEAQGLSVVDMACHMHGADARNQYYYQVDGHLNPSGARQVAAVLHARLAGRDRAAASTTGPGDTGSPDPPGGRRRWPHTPTPSARRDGRRATPRPAAPRALRQPRRRPAGSA